LRAHKTVRVDQEEKTEAAKNRQQDDFYGCGDCQIPFFAVRSMTCVRSADGIAAWPKPEKENAPHGDEALIGVWFVMRPETAPMRRILTGARIERLTRIEL
jgi:hypothetical protein